jgi:hypothetical protein
MKVIQRLLERTIQTFATRLLLHLACRARRGR